MKRVTLMTSVSDTLDDPYLDRLATVHFQPVFIIGPHRSGSTILYKVLMDTGCFGVTTLYHVVNHSRLLKLHFEGQEQKARAELIQFFESRGVLDRQFDHVDISPDIPEEYCYALECRGRRPMLKPSNMKSFTDFCKKVQLLQDPGRPLLLKNPFDTTNFLYIRRIFPEARFVFIHRNPADVISSQIKAIRSMLKHKNEYLALVVGRYRRIYESPIKLALARFICSERLPILFQQVFRNISCNCDYVLQNVGCLGGNTATGLSYPELCKSPTLTARRILEFLGLQEKTHRDYSSLIKPRRARLAPEVKKRLDLIKKRNIAYCRMFGV